MYTLAFSYKLVTSLLQNLLGIIKIFPFVQPNKNKSQKFTTFQRLLSIMSSSTRTSRNTHCLFNIIPKCNRNRSKSHQWSITIVKTITFLTKIILIVHKLLHWYFDITSQTNWLLTTSIIKSIENPQNKQISDMFWYEFTFVHDQWISHTKSHAAVVSPNTDCSCSRLKQAAFYCLDNITKPIFDYF